MWKVLLWPQSFSHAESDGHGCASWKAVLGLLGCAGQHFVAVFGSNQSALETVLLKRRVMMPCWLSLKHPSRIDTPSQVSTCLQMLVSMPYQPPCLSALTDPLTAC